MKSPVPFYAYTLSIIPGLGHIALERRRVGYALVGCTILLLGLMHLAGLCFPDRSILIRIAIGIIFLYGPLVVFALTDLGEVE